MLKDSLKYYEKVRRIYEKNHVVRMKLLSNKQTIDENKLGNGKVVTESAPLIRQPKEQDDQFLDFINQILKQINKLMSKANYDYDYNWTSMVQELDLDEVFENLLQGFFFLNIIKIHQGGELYKFLMTARRTLGEQRLLEAYRITTADELTEFREICFGEYKDFCLHMSWFRILQEINIEKDAFETYTNDLIQYRDNLLELRSKDSAEEFERLKAPEKPFTPYIDDILKAAYDSNIPQDYFLQEIIARAEDEICLDDFIWYCLQKKELEMLPTRFRRDLAQLKTIYLGHPSPGSIFGMRARIERFRNLFFEVDPGRFGPDGEERFVLKLEALDRATWMIEIFSINDDELMMKELEGLLRVPELSGEMNDEESEYFDSDDDESMTASKDD
ncbi:hypothetical protein ABW20_dc0105659 [Dactylellina cionopaga]|nr:hypothetical protein ABW20_dc0105659 [Dactylellina cionopaga]